MARCCNQFVFQGCMIIILNSHCVTFGRWHCFPDYEGQSISCEQQLVHNHNYPPYVFRYVIRFQLSALLIIFLIIKYRNINQNRAGCRTLVTHGTVWFTPIHIQWWWTFQSTIYSSIIGYSHPRCISYFSIVYPLTPWALLAF